MPADPSPGKTKKLLMKSGVRKFRLCLADQIDAQPKLHDAQRKIDEIAAPNVTFPPIHVVSKTKDIRSIMPRMSFL